MMTHNNKQNIHDWAKHSLTKISHKNGVNLQDE